MFQNIYICSRISRILVCSTFWNKIWLKQPFITKRFTPSVQHHFSCPYNTMFLFCYNLCHSQSFIVKSTNSFDTLSSFSIEKCLIFHFTPNGITSQKSVNVPAWPKFCAEIVSVQHHFLSSISPKVFELNHFRKYSIFSWIIPLT